MSKLLNPYDDIRAVNSLALRLFAIIELTLGIEFLFPSHLSEIVKMGMKDFMPLEIWAALFIIFSVVGFYSNNLWKYIFFVSIPLFLFTSVTIEAWAIYFHFVGATGVTTLIACSLGSVIIACEKLGAAHDKAGKRSSKFLLFH